MNKNIFLLLCKNENFKSYESLKYDQKLEKIIYFYIEGDNQKNILDLYDVSRHFETRHQILNKILDVEFNKKKYIHKNLMMLYNDFQKIKIYLTYNACQTFLKFRDVNLYLN